MKPLLRIYVLLAVAAQTADGFASLEPTRYAVAPSSSSRFVSTISPTDSTRTAQGDEGKYNHDIFELSNVQFVNSDEVKAALMNQDEEDESASKSVYPFASMLKGSANFISQHVGQVAVVYIPGDLIESEEFTSLMSDIALSWTLGMKLVLVVGNRFDVDCLHGFENEFGCRNSLPVTDDAMLRTIAEDAGFVRFEVERTLNRFLRRKGGMSPSMVHAPALYGNVVGGNFYAASTFGIIDGVDYKNTGYPSSIHSDRIESVLETNDVVLLTTLGWSRLGEMVSVNGNHLAASIAAELSARKLIFLSQIGCVLQCKGASKTMQELPLTFVQQLLEHYSFEVEPSGYVSFDEANTSLPQGAVELLLHLAWSAWALEEGTYRAHIVNPGDGAILEELFTSKHGVNTCVYREDEASDLDLDEPNVLPFLSQQF